MIMVGGIFLFNQEDVVNSVRKMTSDKEYEAGLANFKRHQESFGVFRKSRPQARTQK